MGRAGITPRAHSGPSPAFPVSRFLERKGSWQRSSLTCRGSKRATRDGFNTFMLCGPGQLYFIPHPHPPEHENCEEMQADILAFLRCCPHPHAGRLSRNRSLPYVELASSGNIWRDISRKDGCSPFRKSSPHQHLFEAKSARSTLFQRRLSSTLSRARGSSVQVSSEQGGGAAALPSKGGGPWFCRGQASSGRQHLFWAGLTAWGLPGIGFLAHWFGWHGKKDICPIETERQKESGFFKD